jgi:pilus assembly protein Flp/PilA
VKRRYYYPLIAFAADRKGITALEYALMVALVAVVIVAAVIGLGTNMARSFNNVSGYLR